MVTEVIYEQGLNIDSITRLTGRVALEDFQNDSGSKASIQFSVRGTPRDESRMRSDFLEVAKASGPILPFRTTTSTGEIVAWCALIWIAPLFKQK